MRFAPALLLLACAAPDPGPELRAILRGSMDTSGRIAALDSLVSSLTPGLPEAGSWRDSLSGYRARLGNALAGASGEAQAEIFLRFLFDTLRLRPDTVGADLALSLPSQVISTRRGSCVGLILLALALAEGRLEAHPVLLPGHMFLRLRAGSGTRNAELLRRGLARSDSFYVARFALASRPWYDLQAGGSDAALAALIFNLANDRLAAGDAASARSAYALVAETLPGFPDALGALGLLELRRGRGERALRLLDSSLKGDSLSEPALRARAEALQSAGRI